MAKGILREMNNFEQYLNNTRHRVESELNRRLPPETTRPAGLHRSMRYGVLGGAKRVRGILCFASCESVGGNSESAVLPATALEILHAYTLIHDDLPAMDNDDLRRGKPSTHKKFGEASAILAGDALLTLAFELLAECVAPVPYPPGQLSLELARATGSQGVIAGQFEDIESEDSNKDGDKLRFIHTHKTADLIRAACRMGGITAGANAKELDILDRYGRDIGVAFQLTDDIMDEIGVTETIGKPTGSDRAKKKMTAISVYGLEETRRQVQTLIHRASVAIRDLPGPTEPLASIAAMIVNRNR